MSTCNLSPPIGSKSTVTSTKNFYTFTRKSGVKTKSDFVRARLWGEAFKIITQDPSKKPYFEKLSEIVAMMNKIGVMYNEAVKALNTYHYVATAQRLLGKLESYSLTLVRLQQQAVLLTKSLESRHE